MCLIINKSSQVSRVKFLRVLQNIKKSMKRLLSNYLDVNKDLLHRFIELFGKFICQCINVFQGVVGRFKRAYHSFSNIYISFQQTSSLKRQSCFICCLKDVFNVFAVRYKVFENCVPINPSIRTPIITYNWLLIFKVGQQREEQLGSIGYIIYRNSPLSVPYFNCISMHHIDCNSRSDKCEKTSQQRLKVIQPVCKKMSTPDQNIRSTFGSLTSIPNQRGQEYDQRDRHSTSYRKHGALIFFKRLFNLHIPTQESQLLQVAIL